MLETILKSHKAICGVLILVLLFSPIMSFAFQSPQLIRLQTLNTPGVIDISWSSDGRYLALGDINSQISIWNAENWTMIASFTCLSDYFEAQKLVWSPTHPTLAVGCLDLSATITETINDITVIRVPTFNQALAWSPDGTQLAIPQADRTIGIYNAQFQLIYSLGEPISSAIPENEPPQLDGSGLTYVGFEWSPSGNYFASIGKGQTTVVTIWDLTTQQAIEHFPIASGITWLADGNSFTIALANEFGDKVLQDWSISPFQLIRTTSILGGDEYVIDGTINDRAIAYCSIERLYLYDIRSGQVLTPQDNITSSIVSCGVNDLAWSSTGLLAIAEQNGTVSIWQVIDPTQPTLTPSPTATPSSGDLTAKVTECVTDRGIRNSLTVKFRNQQWGAFINEVNAQSGKKITVECAADLIEMATYLRDHL